MLKKILLLLFIPFALYGIVGEDFAERNIYKKYITANELENAIRSFACDKVIHLVTAGYLEELIEFLEAHQGMNINFMHRDGYTPLQLAQLLDREDIITILESHQQAAERYQDQLFMALEHDELKILVDFLADHQKYDKKFSHYTYNKTPLEYALELGDPEKVIALTLSFDV